MEKILQNQLGYLSEALDLRRYVQRRGQGLTDHVFVGSDADVADLSRALRRMGLQHTIGTLGDRRIVTLKFIWTPEN